jgi:hypothetical protein
MSEYKKEIGVAVAVAVALAVLVGGTAIYLFPSSVSGSFGPVPPSPVQITAATCSVRNDSCELVMVNTGTVTLQAGGCLFNVIMGPRNGNNNSVIVPGGSGVLSDKLGGPEASVNQPILITPGSSVTAYCTPVGNSPAVGAPVQGQVWWVEPGEDYQYPGFSATWA